MLNPAHVLEVAVLLLIAFLVGATVGSVARAIVLRIRPAKASVSVETAPAPAIAGTLEPALVAAPTIDPIVKPATPTAPADIPSSDFKEVVQTITPSKLEAFAPMSEVRMPTLAPLPAIAAGKSGEIAPARMAGQTTSGQLVASPIKKDEVSSAAVEGGESARVIPFPIERASSVADEAIVPEASGGEAILVGAEQPSPSDGIDTAVGTDAMEAAPHDAPEIETASPSVNSAELVPEVASAIVASEPQVPPASATAEVQPAASSPDDEAAAMRAIEGNWSPKRGASGRSRATRIPEGVDAESAVAAASAAVRAAADATAAVIADQLAEAPGRPEGLDGPRHGVKDNLTNVIGVLPIIEAALNNIGVFHFDQIADFNDKNVAWLEGHLGIGGRIGREHWREQARELAVVSERARKVAGKQ